MELAMIISRVSTEINDDHRVELTLPPETPTGKADLVLSVSPHAAKSIKQPRSSLEDWAEQDAEHWADNLSSADVAALE
jgi:hypothetical protein